MRSTSNAPNPDRNVEKDDFKTNRNESDVTFHRIYTIFTSSVLKNNNIELVLSSFVYRCLRKWQHAGYLVERSCAFEPTDIYILNIIHKHCHYSCGTIAFPRENHSTATIYPHTFRHIIAFQRIKVLKWRWNPSTLGYFVHFQHKIWLENGIFSVYNIFGW